MPNEKENLPSGPLVRCSYKEALATSALKPHPKNRNQHSAEQIERLAKIIEYQGWRRPIRVSNLSGHITAGHGALLAAKLKKWESVPVDYQDYDSTDSEYADLIADNSLSAWGELDLAGINADLKDLDGANFDLDLLGLKDFTLDLSEKNENDPDETPEIKPGPSKVRPGDAFRLGGHRLLCGDCTVKENVERLMAGEKADMVFTSPPYSDLRDYGGNLDLDPKRLSKLFDWPAAIFAVNLGLIIREREIVQYWNTYLEEAKSRSLKLLSWNVWDKEHASAPAHQQAMFGLSHEWVFVFGEYRQLNLTKANKEAGGAYHGSPSVREKDGSLSKRDGTGYSVRQFRQFRQLDSVLNLTRQHNYSSDFTGHPAMFPVHLPETYIEAVTNPAELIADPFLGSGSTLIACEKTNRRCLGMEISPEYCAVVIERWQKYTGLEAVREDGVLYNALQPTA